MIRVETNEFEGSHGKGPRGYGYWMFEIGGGVTVQTTGFSGMYTEAKQMATKWARDHGEMVVRVLP